MDRDLDYEEKRQKELEKLDYHLIRINSNKIDFNDYEEFGRVGAYVVESIKKQTKKSLMMIFQKDFRILSQTNQ